MIRITSLDMPKNDYMKYVRKVIYELNLKDEKDVIDEFPQDSNGPIKAKKGIIYSDDINSNSVLEINNILDSDDKNDDEEFTPKHKKVEDKPKASKENKAFKYSERKTQMVEAFTQVSHAQGPLDEQKAQTKDFGVLVIPKKSNNAKPLTSSIG